MNNSELQIMKNQLTFLKSNPETTMNAIAAGGFCAGFGGDLNGIKVPETLVTGKIPPGVNPQQVFNQVIEFMEQTIRQAEVQQKANNQLQESK